MEIFGRKCFIPKGSELIYNIEFAELVYRIQYASEGDI